MGHVVVGVDGSDGAAEALRWAAREAALHGHTVTALYAWGFIDRHHEGGDRTFDPAFGEDEARAVLDKAVGRALDAGGVPVSLERQVVNGEPAPALVRAAEGADLLVVGARGLGGFARLLLGSVGSQCLEHAPCPVAVVRPLDQGRQGAPPRVVVGVDGSEAARGALAWALDEARARGAALDVVHAWDLPLIGHLGALAFDPVMFRDVGHEVLDEAISAAEARAAGVGVHRLLARGPAARVLIERGRRADLLVVGARGLGGFAGLLLGSVSHRVATGAPCPVVVVRDRS
ncbi:MAG: universal stress protein [Acidimicrobiia bacterium]